MANFTTKCDFAQYDHAVTMLCVNAQRCTNGASNFTCGATWILKRAYTADFEVYPP